MIINYISSFIVPFFILLIIFFGLKEKQNVYDLFIEGSLNGIKTVFQILPNLIAIFLIINLIQDTGLIYVITKIITPLTNLLGVPNEILPLALLRPISGSGSLAILQDILTKEGVDSYIGLIACNIMGAAETTFFTIAIYSSAIKIKITKELVIAALSGDIMVIFLSCIIYSFA